jgi:hypothetical protein
MTSTTINTSTTTPDDVAFLKVATSAPDYENLPVEGIPDSYSGPTYVKKDYIYTTVSAQPGQITYFVVTPTAGVAYYTWSYDLDAEGQIPFPPISVNAKSTVFPDALSLFEGCAPGVVGRCNNTTTTARGRLMGQGAELACLNNSLLQYGSITTFKSPLDRILTPEFESSGLDVSKYRINGCAAIFRPVVNSEATVTPVRDGSYAVSMNREADFEFAPVLDDVGEDQVFQGYTEANVPSPGENYQVNFLGPSVLWDNGFDSIVFRIVVPPSDSGGTINPVPQSFVMKVFKTWEFQPVANSLLHSLAHASPDLDQRTINIYHQMSKELPVSVPASQNPDFWNKVVDGLHDTSGVLSGVPILQPYAKGVHALTTLGRNLMNRRRNRRAQRKAAKARVTTQVVKVKPRPPRQPRQKGTRRRVK